MRITPEIYKSLKADIATAAETLGIDVATADGGMSGLKTMHGLLDIVSRNRAYSDEHPAFLSGRWQRVLPYDGRDYCFYYSNGCDDTHVATALRRIKTELTPINA